MKDNLSLKRKNVEISKRQHGLVVVEPAFGCSNPRSDPL